MTWSNSLLSQNGYNNGHEQAGWKPFAANIADGESDVVSIKHKIVIKAAANIVGGPRMAAQWWQPYLEPCGPRRCCGQPLRGSLLQLQSLDGVIRGAFGGGTFLAVDHTRI